MYRRDSSDMLQRSEYIEAREADYVGASFMGIRTYLIISFKNRNSWHETSSSGQVANTVVPWSERWFSSELVRDVLVDDFTR
jgi:hypothetical protein